MQPVFPQKEQAIGYAQERARFRACEIDAELQFEAAYVRNLSSAKRRPQFRTNLAAVSGDIPEE